MLWMVQRKSCLNDASSTHIVYRSRTSSAHLSFSKYDVVSWSGLGCLDSLASSTLVAADPSRIPSGSFVNVKSLMLERMFLEHYFEY